MYGVQTEGGGLQLTSCSMGNCDTDRTIIISRYRASLLLNCCAIVGQPKPDILTDQMYLVERQAFVHSA